MILLRPGEGRRRIISTKMRHSVKILTATGAKRAWKIIKDISKNAVLCPVISYDLGNRDRARSLQAIIRCCGKDKCSKVSKKVRTSSQNRSTEDAEKTTRTTEVLVLSTRGFSVAPNYMNTAKADELSASTSTLSLG